MPYVTRVLVLTLLLSSAAAPVASAAGTGWSLAPSGGGRPSFYAEGAPGTVVRDTVAVSNPGADPVTVTLAADGVRAAFADARVRVPARTRAEVPFTVRVPGDRSGAIVARDGTGRTRSVPVRLRAGVPELSALTVERPAVRGDRITYQVVNRGTTALVPRLAVRADGLFGRVLDRAPRTLPVRIAPGARLTLTEPWPDHPALDAVDVRLTVTAPDGTRATADTSARFLPGGAAAWTAGAALVAALGALITVRRRRRRPPAAEAAPVPGPGTTTGEAT